MISIFGGGNIGDEIILTKRKPNIIDIEYWCEITEYMNEDIRKNYGEFSHYFKCYIYDCRSWCDKTVAIRMPGSTIGCIRFDDRNVIVECCIDADAMSKNNCFSKDINERLKRFVGRTLIFPEE